MNETNQDADYDSQVPWTATFVTSSLEELTTQTRQFAVDRDWLQYHTPRNILLALTGELGELAELVQWKGDDVSAELSGDEIDKMAQEIADVTIYLFRLADVCNVSLKNEMELLEQE